jgi:alpha-galactosidase
MTLFSKLLGRAPLVGKKNFTAVVTLTPTNGSGCYGVRFASVLRLSPAHRLVPRRPSYPSRSMVKSHYLLLLGCLFIFLFSNTMLHAQQKTEKDGVLTVSNPHVKIIVHTQTGKVDYLFTNGTAFNNTIAYVEDLKQGLFISSAYTQHQYTTDNIKDPLGKGICINLVHETTGKSIRLTQYITIYEQQPFILISSEAEATIPAAIIETRNISPFSILPETGGKVVLAKEGNLFTDYPYDNDNWVDVISQKWPGSNGTISGMSYELASVYNEQSNSGFAVGNLVHDFWKTGIRYGTGINSRQIDSLIIYGGAATRDNGALPDSYGGKDGTHDVIPHGTQTGVSVTAPLLYLAASADIRNDMMGYGKTVQKIAGSKKWKQAAPFYWNSFGVEGVLGYEKVMMPLDVAKVSDFIHTLDQFNKTTKPVLSIDSYDQGIYSTEVLKSVSRYGKKKGQQMGFYFIPFALWTWKNSIQDAKLNLTDHPLREVILLDEKNNYVPYKDGDWGAFPIDPTHPYVREYIIKQLLKAKAIDAKFIKIDFLSAGALESTRRYDPAVRSGKQAYNYGMKMLQHLTDSILGPDIFITQAISPLFPHQYAHTRFLSTDVYSHLRNDQPGFPHYGSTAASMVSATHFWWTQGTLWPYTNMDVIVMKNFQKHKDISEQDVKVRLFSMMVLGSVFGDGTDYRSKQAAERARKFLNNEAVCAFFSNPKAFTPLNFPVGNGQSQQLSSYLSGDTILLSAFNFSTDKLYKAVFEQAAVKWQNKNYKVVDFLTGTTIGHIKNGEHIFSIEVPVKDAVLVKLIEE